MSSFLLSAVEVSNIVSMLSVLFCFCLMILFIIRHIIQGRDERNDSNRTFSINVPRTDLVPIRIPFTFRLLEGGTSSYSALQYSISSEIPYKVGIYWGVNVKEFHFFLRRSWTDILKSFDDGSFLEENYQSSDTYRIENCHPEENFTTSYKNKTPLDLGNPPRPRYPLVIILIQSNNGVNHEENQVALVNIIHIKDLVCTLPTCVLAQYLKQSNGQLSCLKQLYLSAGGPVEDDTPVPMSVLNSNKILPENILTEPDSQCCIVCQSYPLSRALLPCRHTCVCAKCFHRLERCPICRGPIKSYFCIRNEDYMNLENNTNKDTVRSNRSLWNWLENWDDRITDFLGFRR